MKAVILAAGKGSRLGDITKEIPKPLIDYKGMPIIFYHINNCIKNNISEICINTHYLSEQIIKTVKDKYSDLIELNFSYEPELLGTAGALNNFKEYIGGDDFVVIYGDNIIEHDLNELYDFHKEKGGIATILGHFKDDVSMSGVIMNDDDHQITQFIEKPKDPNISSKLVNAGIYILSPEIFKYIPGGESDFGKNIFPELLEKNEKLFVYPTQKKLIAIDTPSLYNSMKNDE